MDLTGKKSCFNIIWIIITNCSDLWGLERNTHIFTVMTHRSATARSLSGLKVPSVSMYMALPSPPPWSMGSCGQKAQSKPSVHLKVTVQVHAQVVQILSKVPYGQVGYPDHRSWTSMMKLTHVTHSIIVKYCSRATEMFWTTGPVLHMEGNRLNMSLHQDVLFFSENENCDDK